MQRCELVDYLGELLSVDAVRDYCPNGLQVEGQAEVSKVVTGVTACLALLDEAVARQADTVLVHHGYFWKHDDACVTGPMKRRLQTLLRHDINLLVYHLPLDTHPELGNNALLGQAIGCEQVMHTTADGVAGLLWHGTLPQRLTGEAFHRHLADVLQREPLHIAADARPIQRLAWCTGAAQDLLPAAAALGVDAFISGEVSERTVHLAREYGIHYYAAGHHATERFGIQALGAHLAQRFPVSCEFVDIANPV